MFGIFFIYSFMKTKFSEFISESVELSQVDNLVKGLGNVKNKQVLLNDDLIIINLREELDSVDKDYFELYKKKFIKEGYKLFYNNLENIEFYLLVIKIDSDIFKWIEKNLFNLKSKINHDDKEYINKRGKWMFYHENQQDLKNEYLYINCDRVWSVFISKYNLQSQQIQYITKCLLEEHYKFRVLTTEICW